MDVETMSHINKVHVDFGRSKKCVYLKIMDFTKLLDLKNMRQWFKTSCLVVVNLGYKYEIRKTDAFHVWSFRQILRITTVKTFDCSSVPQASGILN